MAFPVALETTQPDVVNVENVGIAPALAMGNLFMATSQALSLAANNATHNQQLAWTMELTAMQHALATHTSMMTKTVKSGSGSVTADFIA